MLRHYATVELDPNFAALARDQLHQTIADRDQAAKLLQDQLTRQLAKLDVKENNLIDLAADGQLPQAKIRQRLHRINDERTKLTTQLAETDDQLDADIELLNAAVDLLDNLQDAYLQTTDHGRRLLNQAIFNKLYIDGNTIISDVLHEPSPPPTGNTRPRRRPGDYDRTRKGRQRTGGPTTRQRNQRQPTSRPSIGRGFE